MNTFTIIALSVGIALMLLELIIPGGIAFCMGLSSILVGLAYQFSFITNPFTIFFTWCGLSVASSAIGIIFIQKMFNTGESIKDYYDEDTDAYGKTAVAVENISEKKGRIMFQGTGWNAISMSGDIKKDEKARIVGRDNLTFFVEPHEENEFNNLNPKEEICGS